MFFSDYLNSCADILQSRFLGYSRRNQNPADKGELCEIFVKQFLEDFLLDNFKIFRGGKIIDIDNNESKQLDIVLAAKNTLKIFGDKGIYPIESIFGVFSITATLDHGKFRDCIDEFNAIPNNNPKFMIMDDLLSQAEVIEKWKENLPFKCVFGFSGDINQTWADELNEFVLNKKYDKNSLPDYILVNKKGTIKKNNELTKLDYLKKGIKLADFHFTDLNLFKYNGVALLHILNDLFVLHTWQYKITPEYFRYFNRDIGEIAPEYFRYFNRDND